jgi:hypothetical protein
LTDNNILIVLIWRIQEKTKWASSICNLSSSEIHALIHQQDKICMELSWIHSYLIVYLYDSIEQINQWMMISVQKKHNLVVHIMLLEHLLAVYLS